jgi:hypothetical protein
MPKRAGATTTHDGELITYESQPGPFCGECETLKLTAASDGRVWIERGHWAGNYEDWRTTVREHQLTPEEFRRFRAALGPYRPSGTRTLDEGACASFISDGGGVSIRWRGGGGDAELFYNFGCDPENRREMFRAITHAPAVFGLHYP